MSTVSSVRAPKTAAAPAVTQPDFTGVVAKKDRYGNLDLVYTVKAGDTVSKIATRTGSDVDAIAWANNLENPNKIRVGQELRLPTTFHTIAKGDTYSAIAKKLGLPVKELQGINTTPATKLIPGKDLTVPAVTITPAQKATRAALLAEMKDAAKGEGKLWFGEGTMTTFAAGHDLGTSGPYESGQFFRFSDDFKTVKFGYAEGGDEHTVKLEEPARDLRRILVAQQLEGLGRELEAKLNGKKGHGWKSSGAVITPGKNGSVTVTVKAAQDRVSMTWNERDGLKLVGVPNAEKPIKVLRASDVGVAAGKALGLKLPLYPVGE